MTEPARVSPSARLTLRVALPVALALLPAGSSVAQTQDAYPWRMQEVAEGVHAALQPAERRFDESNSLVIIGVNEVVVVEAQADPAAVAGLIDWIRSTTDAPVTTVINTHWHGDHTQGNALYRDAFGDDVEFVGHATLVEDVPQRAAAFVHERIAYFEAELPAARERLAQGVFRDGTEMNEADRAEQAEVLERAAAWMDANRDARFQPPTRTYTFRQRLVRAGHVIELLHFEAHTRGDTVVWLPELGVAATGDLLDDMPYAGHGYPTSWRAALADLRELPIQHIVPGHGPVFDDLAKLEAIDRFLAELIGYVGAARAAGTGLATAMNEAELAAARDALASDEAAARFFDQVLAEAVERAWIEAAGKIDE